MADKDDRDRSVNRPWWVDALDPVENLRALANVQDFGRIAAEELADRLLAGRDGRDGAPTGTAASDAELDQLVRRFQAEAIRAGDTWANFIDLFASLVGVLSRLPGRPGPAPGPAPVVLEAATPGISRYRARIEADVGRVQVLKGTEKQQRADEGHERERHLHDDQTAS